MISLKSYIRGRVKERGDSRRAPSWKSTRPGANEFYFHDLPRKRLPRTIALCSYERDVSRWSPNAVAHNVSHMMLVKHQLKISMLTIYSARLEHENALDAKQRDAHSTIPIVIKNLLHLAEAQVASRQVARASSRIQTYPDDNSTKKLKK